MPTGLRSAVAYPPIQRAVRPFGFPSQRTRDKGLALTDGFKRTGCVVSKTRDPSISAVGEPCNISQFGL